MGFQKGSRSWKTGAETFVGNAQERGMNDSDFVEGNRAQAVEYAKSNENIATVFIGAGHRDMIIEAKDKMSAAKYIARNEPHLVPDFIIDDIQQQAAFLVAFAEELNKPEYNQ